MSKNGCGKRSLPRPDRLSLELINSKLSALSSQLYAPCPISPYNIIAPLVDMVAYNPSIDYLRKDKDIVYIDNFACPQLYQRLVIGSDGGILMCSMDEDGENIVGNTYNQTVHEVWHGEELEKILKIHNCPNGFLGISLCRSCCYPRKTKADERAVVNGREIWIEN